MSDTKTDLQQGEEIPRHELRLVIAAILSKTGPVQVSMEDVMMLLRSELLPVFVKSEDGDITTFSLQAFDGE